MGTARTGPGEGGRKSKREAKWAKSGEDRGSMRRGGGGRKFLSRLSMARMAAEEKSKSTARGLEERLQDLQPARERTADAS